jgi:exosome complex RNA-binding protein Rrp42 (RNase PH superfamily)
VLVSENTTERAWVQLSVAVTTGTAGIWLQETEILAGVALKTGSTPSTTVITWDAEVLLPQASTAFQVRVMV